MSDDARRQGGHYPGSAILFIFLILVTYVPWISTFVPTQLMGPEIITK